MSAPEMYDASVQENYTVVPSNDVCVDASLFAGERADVCTEIPSGVIFFNSCWILAPMAQYKSTKIPY